MGDYEENIHQLESISNNIQNPNDATLTTYDRLMRAWQNSMEMVRDFEMYSKRIEDSKLQKVFKKFAEDEGKHASKLKELLLEYKESKH